MDDDASAGESYKDYNQEYYHGESKDGEQESKVSGGGTEEKKEEDSVASGSRSGVADSSRNS